MSELPIFVKWLEAVSWLIVTVEKFPKRMKSVLNDRILNLALDVVEDFSEARYAKTKIHHLKKANLRLEKIRILLRICHEHKIIASHAYQHAMFLINEVGKMLGGWIKEQTERGERA